MCHSPADANNERSLMAACHQAGGRPQGPRPQRAARLLQDVNGLQVAAAAQAQHRVHGQRGKVVLVVRQDLAAQRRARDVQQVLPRPWISM